jgi:hypothetical protein
LSMDGAGREEGGREGKRNTTTKRAAETEESLTGPLGACVFWEGKPERKDLGGWVKLWSRKSMGERLFSLDQTLFTLPDWG